MSNFATIPEYKRKDCVLPGQPFVDELRKSIGWKAFDSTLSFDQRNALAWQGQQKIAAFGRTKFFQKDSSDQLRLLLQWSKEIIDECDAQRNGESVTFIVIAIVLGLIVWMLKYVNVIGK